ncbi:MAG: sigma-70 family RNA polymerase sigma factor [Verrucomicrobiota bacterium]
MPQPETSRSDDELQKALLGLLLKHQRAVYAYIFALAPNEADAEDLLQETFLTIYEKFGDFEEGTDFVLWANRIAFWKVKEARKKFARSKVVFDEKVLEAVSETATEMEKENGARHEALSACLQKLNERDRRMVLARYERGGTIEEAARTSGRTVAAAYKSLARIRQLLQDCVSLRVDLQEKGMAL